MQIDVGSFVLASLITSYPDESFADGVRALLNDDGVNLPQSLRQRLESLASSEDKLNDLRSEYIQIFDLSKAQNPLYETEYGRERAMFKAKELSDIAGFYHAFGFEMHAEEGGREMPDHISVELEFYSLLLMKHLYLQEAGDKEGCEIVFDAMKKFMTDHLGRFAPAITDRPGVLSNEFYSEVFNWCAALAHQESARIGANPEKATWLSSQIEAEEVKCGATVVTNK